jgi:hypothetical protein
MDIIRSLEATRDETLKHFKLGEPDLSRAYAPGKWSVRFVLHHLADAETVFFDRIRRVLSEGKRVIWAFDQDAWANALDYPKRPLELSSRIYASARDGIIYYARLHYEANGHLEFVHSETGLRTLKGEFDRWPAHNAGHLDQIRTALRT